MSTRVEDAAAKVELLLQAAEAQQAIAASALEQLRAYPASLDVTVREEIRATLIAELRALGEDAAHASGALRGLARAASLRFLLWNGVSAALAAGVPFALAWWLLPTPAEVNALRATRDTLRAQVTQLEQQGARMEISRCGSNRRLCVRVDRRAGVYGAAGDFFVMKGY